MLRSTAPRRRPGPSLRVLVPALVAVIACGRDTARPRAADGTERTTGGTVVVATPAEPNTLLPPLATGTQSAAIVAQLFDRLAEPGDSLNVVGDAGFRPRLAQKWSWATDSLSIAFQLDPRARWHDGQPVTARDVAFTFALYTDPATASPFAPLLANIDSVTVRDSLTALVWFKRRLPQQFFDVTYQLWILPEHLLRAVPRNALARSAFGREPVGSGRFRFGSWTRGQRIELVADPDNYRGRALLDRVVWSVAPDFGSATIMLIAGDADFLEVVPIETVSQLEKNRSLHLVPYPSLDYGFLQFNLRASDGSGRPNPIFGDSVVRRALTMAVDRPRVVKNVWDSLAYVAVGPLTRAIFPDWARIRQIPYDLPRARALLDSAGWTVGAEGVRARGGVPLAFSILVPTSSRVRQSMAVLLQEQLRAVGARVDIERLEINTFVERQRGRRFDAAMGGWHSDPSPGSLRQTWGSLGARTAGGSNYGSYESRAFDAAVDSALSTLSPEKARAYWLRAYQTIVDEAPAIWLFEPRLVAGAHTRIRITGTRADAWWAGMADWEIPVGARIGRDRVGLR